MAISISPTPKVIYEI